MAKTPDEVEDEVLQEMMADTEKEIFGDAIGEKELDSDEIDTQPEQMEGVDGQPLGDEGEPEEDEGEEPEEETPEEEQEEDSGDEPAEQEPDQRMVPSHRLREEANARRLAEARTAELDARLKMLEAQQRQPQQPPTQPQQEPDMFADPEGWQRVHDQRLMQQWNAQRVEMSLQAAASERGEYFMEAHRRLAGLRASNPAADPMIQQMMNSWDPGKAVLQWFDQNGGQQWESERNGARRQQLIAELSRIDGQDYSQNFTTQQRGQPRQRNVIRGPVSLNGASGKGTHRELDPDLYDNSERAVFDFATRR